MKPELDQKLVTRFPVLYQDRHSPMAHTCMCWGFDCGDGWFDIIWQLSLAIEDELGYSWTQERWFLFKKAFARRWSDLMYKLSPVRQTKYKQEGTGKPGDPYHMVLVSTEAPRWDEKIAQFFFGKMRRIGKFETERMFLKRLVFWPNTGFAVTQVKEKFGTLRFYSDGNDRIWRLVRFADALSAITCELCGEPGKLGERYGWYSTRCTKCAPEGWTVGKD